MSEVILVNENDERIGQMEKMEAHEKGHLHRCFSIFIFNAKNQMLIHRRALEKYHCGGEWTNACCSHQEARKNKKEKDETTIEAIQRRLPEEMGIDCELQPLLTFIYKAAFENGLTEHEFDHVFVGQYDEEKDGFIHPNPEEVMEYKWVEVPELLKDIKSHPEDYTTWFKIIVQEVLDRKDNLPDAENIPHLGRLAMNEEGKIVGITDKNMTFVEKNEIQS